jgi:hypothetical protein
VDGLDRTVSTRRVCGVRAENAEKIGCDKLRLVKGMWTHCAEDDRALWGFQVHDDHGRILAYG